MKKLNHYLLPLGLLATSALCLAEPVETAPVTLHTEQTKEQASEQSEEKGPAQSADQDNPVTTAEAPAPAVEQPLDGQQLLAFIDGLRGYKGESFSFELSNISYKKGQAKHRNKLAVKVLNNASLVEFVAPARSKGRKILKQAQNMWIRFPGTRNVLRISPAQRLLGEASNGDVTGTNFSEDYDPLQVSDDTLDGQPVIKLQLQAKHRKTTYKQVVFYLDPENHQPLRGDFYARSGKLVKQAYYTEFKAFDGALKLHKMRLVNPIIDGSYTWMMFDHYRKRDLDPAIFHKDALSR